MAVTHLKKDIPSNEKYTDPNAHELGGTLGATVGGVAAGIGAGVAAGAAIGGLGGPVGAVVGAAIGGAIGGKAGEAVAREVNPTEEEQYWSQEYRSRPYVAEGSDYEAYRPAYRYGAESTTKFENRAFDDVEADLERNWQKARGTSSLEWNDAREPVRDAYLRVQNRAIK